MSDFIHLDFISVPSEITGEIPTNSSRAGSKLRILTLTYVRAFREQIKPKYNQSNENLFSIFHLP